MNSSINYSGFVDLLKKPSTDTIHLDGTEKNQGKGPVTHHKVQLLLALTMHQQIWSQDKVNKPDREWSGLRIVNSKK